MLLINALRALLVLTIAGLYSAYVGSPLTIEHGAVLTGLTFVGLVVHEIVEEKLIDSFNSENAKEGL